MHSAAREEFTNICVARDGRWYTGPKEIVNHRVISHFKQNLFRDDKGIYVYQTFRQFSEKGYLRVEGPLLTVFRVDADTIVFDSLDEISASEAEVVMNTGDESPYVFYPRLRCYASVPAGVAPYFSDLLGEHADGFTFCGKPVIERAITEWS